MDVSRGAERRFVSGQLNASEPDAKVIEGVAAVFNQQAELAPGRFEVILPGAFRRTLAHGADVRCLFNHDENLILARTKSGTLELWEDDDGLHYRASLDPLDPDSARIYAKIKRGDVSQSSFYFRVEKGGERFSTMADGSVLREITSVKLYDVSPVTYPAYEYTIAEARAAFQHWDGAPAVMQSAAPEQIAEQSAFAPEPALHVNALCRQRLSELQLRVAAGKTCCMEERHAYFR